MSNNIDHRISVALGLRLGFHAGAGITYNPSNPMEHKDKPVALSDDGTVILAAADATPIGAVILVEPPDAMSTKVAVNLGPVVWFNMDAAPAAGDFGKGVVADTGGKVKVAASGGFGKIISYDELAKQVFVLTYQ